MLMQAGVQTKLKSGMWPMACIAEVQLSTTQEAVNCMLACISSERCHCAMERCNSQSMQEAQSCSTKKQLKCCCLQRQHADNDRGLETAALRLPKVRGIGLSQLSSRTVSQLSSRAIYSRCQNTSGKQLQVGNTAPREAIANADLVTSRQQGLIRS